MTLHAEKKYVDCGNVFSSRIIDLYNTKSNGIIIEQY